MKRKIVFFNRNEPYLIFPAATLFLQLGGHVQIEPSDVNAMVEHELNDDDEIYIIDIGPETEGELKKLIDFEIKNKNKIQLWINEKEGQNTHSLTTLIGMGYKISPDGRSTIKEITKKDFATSNKAAERILRAYQAQISLDFNTDHPKGINRILKEMISELISGKENAEINALAEIQKVAEKKMNGLLRFWSTTSIRGQALKAYPFQKISLIKLEEEKELDPFIDLAPLIQLLKTKTFKFILEYNCRGKIHYLYFRKDIMVRSSYSDRIGKQFTRIKAANKLL